MARVTSGKGESRETRMITLEPRSAYVLDGEARWRWQHHIPAIAAPRYSITFRTLRERYGAGRSGGAGEAGGALA